MGNDVSIKFDGSIEYVQIKKCLSIKLNNCVFMLLFPHWYERRLTHENDFTVVEKWSANKDGSLLPSPPDAVIEHVLIFHNCNRCDCQTKTTCGCRSVCKVVNNTDVHCSLNEYIVIDYAKGFEMDY